MTALDAAALAAMRDRAERAVTLPRTLSETTCLFWREVVLTWAESRLMPPQYAECVTALTQVTPTATALAADVLALLARVAELEREIAHGRQLAEMFPEAGPE